VTACFGQEIGWGGNRAMGAHSGSGGDGLRHGGRVPKPEAEVSENFDVPLGAFCDERNFRTDGF